MLKPINKKSIKKARIRRRIIDFITKEVWQYAIVIGFAVAIAIIFKRPIECASFCVSHVALRPFFNKEFHIKPKVYSTLRKKLIAIFLCLWITITIIFFGTLLCMPLDMSLLSGIFLSYIVCYLGYIIQDRLELIAFKKEVLSVSLENCTKEQMIAICKELGYCEEKTDIAVMLFVERKTNKQVWEILCKTQRNVEWDTVTTYKHRIKKDLINYFKERG